MTLKDFFKNDKYAELSGVELIEIGEGRARTKMNVNESHFNAGNVVQGGAIFTLADLAFAAAAHSYGYLTVSLETSIRFFKSTNSGTLYAEANIVNKHPKIPTYEVEITDEHGTLIALFTVTGYTKNIPITTDK
ncbi:acyl-CoA thioesterase [Dysgonomonadaceae bacterium PH5-43]|nr:acyl-CoA thioesterase [Dysgonomonadaceae bacterium PH5-43]